MFMIILNKPVSNQSYYKVKSVTLYDDCISFTDNRTDIYIVINWNDLLEIQIYDKNMDKLLNRLLPQELFDMDYLLHRRRK